MPRILKLSLLSLLLAAVSGCGGSHPWLRPSGTVQYQRHNAVLHDPYPDTYLAPEVVGGRPRDYQKQLAEPVISRGLFDSWWFGR